LGAQISLAVDGSICEWKKRGSLALKISIVTPSYNQAAYLEQCMRSVLDQRYPNLEYVVMDGGSTDGSTNVIGKYEDQLLHWESHPDNGHYDAINRGFAKTSGEIMAWLNSDDLYTPWTLSTISEVFTLYPEVEWITTLHQVVWNDRGQAILVRNVPGYNRNSFLRGENLLTRPWNGRFEIQQESTFWRRSLWERSGGKVDTSYHLAGDFELWARFYEHADLHGVGAILGGFRVHGSQKTATQLGQYYGEAEHVLSHYAAKPRGRLAGLFRRYFMIPAEPKLLQIPGATRLLYRSNVILYSVANKTWEKATRWLV
jgi:glycosyltransferase involved in cell wall biosynthesis